MNWREFWWIFLPLLVILVVVFVVVFAVGYVIYCIFEGGYNYYLDHKDKMK